MGVRYSMIVLVLMCLLLPLCADENQVKLYIKDVSYNGTDIRYRKITKDIVEAEINGYNMFEIIDRKNDAEYILGCSITENGDNVIVALEIEGTISSLNEVVVRNENKEIGLVVLIEEAVKYIHTKVFPYEMYVQKNQSYFTTKKMKSLYSQDVIDRNRDILREPPIQLFDPLTTKLFNNHRIQIIPSIEVSFPLNLSDYGVYQAPYINLPIHVYLFNTEMVMFSLMIEGFFIPLSKKIAIDQFNYLKIWGIGGGIGICFPLPFYRKIGLHLNLSSGWLISLLTSEAYANDTNISNDPFLHPTFEIEHTITEHMSISAKFSYIWISYIGAAEDLHSIQSGIGIGIRF